MELICNAAAAALQAASLPTEAAMPFGAVSRVREARITVQVTSCAAEGRYTYLGMFETEGEPLELYGHRLKATLTGTVHSPVSGGAEDCAALAEEAADCWLGGVTGLTIGCVTTNAPVYDAEMDCFTATVCADVSAWVYALPVDDGMYFEDFALKGQLLA